MKAEIKIANSQRRSLGGFTLAEVVISAAIAAISIGGIVSGYIISANRAEWTLCSSAAQVMAARHLEQSKTARWDSFAGSTELDSLNGTTSIEALDIPVTGTGVIFGTNTVTVEDVPASDPPLKMVRVDCEWSLVSRGPFTNTAFALRFQEQ